MLTDLVVRDDACEDYGDCTACGASKIKHMLGYLGMMLGSKVKQMRRKQRHLWNDKRIVKVVGYNTLSVKQTCKSSTSLLQESQFRERN